jgi:hypothetical protein
MRSIFYFGGLLPGVPLVGGIKTNTMQASLFLILDYREACFALLPGVPLVGGIKTNTMQALRAFHFSFA